MLTVKFIWDRAADQLDVNAVNKVQYAAIHGATHRGAHDLLQFLVDRGANLDAANGLGWTPLTIAGGVWYPNIYENLPETEEFLLALGAKDPGKRRPIDAQPQQEGGPTR